MSTESRPIPPEDLFRHADFLRALARSLVRDEALADDLTQDTWIAAIESPPADPLRIRSWLAQVARRFASRSLRGSRRREARERTVARAEATSGDHAAVGHDETLRRVSTAVLGLREPYRQTVLLRFYEGLTPRQIGARMNVPADTVYSRLRRALRELEGELDRTTGGDRDAWVQGLLPLCGGRGAALVGWTTGVTLMSAKLKIAAGVVVTLIAAEVLRSRLSEPELDSVAPDPVAVAEAETVARYEPDGERLATTADAAPSAGDAPAAPEPDDRASELASLTIVVTWADDGAPAVGELYQILEWSRPDPLLSAHVLRTDARGRIELSELEPGRLLIYGQRGGGSSIDVAAGADQELALEIPDGIDVDVTVTDASGAPIAEASVWVSEYGNPGEGAVLGTTDVHGRLRLRDVGPSRQVGAYARGFAASGLTAIVGAPGDRMAATIVLNATAGAVAGSVYGPVGQPIAGAHVRVVPRVSDDRPSLEVETDEHGAFQVDGAPAGWAVVAVRARGFAPRSEPLVVDAVDRATVVVRLEPPGIVYGVVRDEAGAPVAEASLYEGDYGSFTGSFAKTSDDGRFRLDHLPVGEVDLRIEAPEVGRLTERLVLTAGEPLEWNPVLKSGPRLAGRVFDEHGDPWVGWNVRAIGSTLPGTLVLWSEDVETDADGRFEFLGVPDESLRLELFTSRRDPYAQHKLSAEPSPDELAIEIPSSALPSAWIAGELVHFDGAPAHGEVRALARGGGPTWGPGGSLDETGAFRIGPLRPGRYALYFELPGRAACTYGEFDVAANEDRDVGTLELGDAARLEIEVDGVVGALAPFDTLRVEPIVPRASAAIGLTGWSRSPQELDRSTIADVRLDPGEYRLIARGADVVPAVATVLVVAGETARATFRTESGRSCTVVLLRPEDSADALRHLSIVTPDGVVLARHNEMVPKSPETTWTFRLAPGAYILNVRVHPNATATRALKIDASDEPYRLSVDLRE